MPDLMDAVQLHALQHAEDALQHHANRPVQVGRTHCENLDCGEPIHPARTALGARLCLECQKGVEAEAAHFRAWRGGR